MQNPPAARPVGRSTATSTTTTAAQAAGPDQLLENKAALLKSYLEKAATACTDVLARDVLKI